jgi:hypothetical protein
MSGLLPLRGPPASPEHANAQRDERERQDEGEGKEEPLGRSEIVSLSDQLGHNVPGRPGRTRPPVPNMDRNSDPIGSRHDREHARDDHQETSSLARLSLHEANPCRPTQGMHACETDTRCSLQVSALWAA